MKLNPLKSNFLRKYSNYVLFFALVLIICVITYYRFKVQLSVGPSWDAYDFLANAAEFAGKGIGYSDQVRPPMISFLTSIYFRFDGLYEGAILAVDSVLFIIGCIGLYLLLKLRFNSLNSFIGTLIYALSPLTLSIVSAGWSDISSVSFVIWAVYFLIKAFNNNSKYLYASFALLMFAFLTRYAASLIVFPVFLYIIINKRNRKINRDILIGSLIAILILSPVLSFFYLKFGNPIYPFLNFMGSSEGSALTQHFAYNPDFFFYIKNMPTYLGFGALAIFLIILTGFFGILLRKNKDLIGFKVSIFKIKNDHNLFLMTIFLIICILSLGFVHYLITELIFFGFCYYFYQFLKGFGNKKYLKMDFLFFSWVMVFFIFQSMYVIKVDRYFILMIPPLTYFLIRGFKIVTDLWRLKINSNLVTNVFSLILIFMILIASISFIIEVSPEENESKIINDNIISASNWLKDYDPNYKNEIIYSDYWSYSSWYLKMDVKKMPIFIDNQILYSWSKDQNFTYQDNLAYNRELEINNVKYYFCGHSQLNLTNYRPLKHFGNVIIYVKTI